ncbi:MAG: hypothetical protein HYV60_21295, partial [Planctomycetia bacterium]|nr:hypothetical protein [Planctomycetia bacterium]
VAAASVAENAGATATTVTIARNTGTSGALVVNLTSSDPSEATLPATATIPAGQASVTVALAAVDDNVMDGIQTVTITASASGFADGTDAIDVLDQDQDADQDGVLDDLENAAPNGGDGNGDGVPDNQQPHVTSLPNARDGQYVTFAASSGTSLNHVQATADPPAVAPAGAVFPLGFFAYEIANVAPGAAVMLTIDWHAAAGLNTFLKYGPTPDDPIPHWYPFLFESQGGTGAKIYADRIEVYYVDGLRGDDDLAANGIVVDPGVPATTAHPWRNPVWPENVNNDSAVSPLDALVVINEINARGPRELPLTPIGNQVLPPFWDVNGDGHIGPIDVLVVINYINSNLAWENEAVTVASSFSMIGDAGPPREVNANVALDVWEQDAPSRFEDAIVAVAANRPGQVRPVVPRPTGGQLIHPQIARWPSSARSFARDARREEFLNDIAADRLDHGPRDAFFAELATDATAAW